MELTNTKKLLDEIMNMNVPISNTSRGEQIQQTYRNNLTAALKEALFEDCLASLTDTDGVAPYLTKEGVVLEIPNQSIADNLITEYGSGAISIIWNFTIKGLDYNAAEMAEEFDLTQETKRVKAAEAEKKKAAKIARDKAAREAREMKRAKMQEDLLKLGKV